MCFTSHFRGLAISDICCIFFLALWVPYEGSRCSGVLGRLYRSRWGPFMDVLYGLADRWWLIEEQCQDQVRRLV